MVDVECPVSGFSESFIGLNLRKTTDVRSGSIGILAGTACVHGTVGVISMEGTAYTHGSVGVEIKSTHDYASQANANVTTSPAMLLDGNDNRISAIIRNMGGTALYLGLGVTPSAGVGIWLDEGDAYEINQTNLFKGTVVAVSPDVTLTGVTEF